MYVTTWIIRFEGELTQGPNAGKKYTFATSWAGVQFTSVEQAKSQLAEYKRREPGLKFQLFSRTFDEDAKKMRETLIG